MVEFIKLSASCECVRVCVCMRLGFRMTKTEIAKFPELLDATDFVSS